MSYDIHIERETPFTLAEWTSAVMADPDVRLSTKSAWAVSPDTGEVVSSKRLEGDAEVRLDGEWRPCFMWSPSGSVIFSAPRDFETFDSPVRSIARRLAARLSATVVGDEGEEYD